MPPAGIVIVTYNSAGEIGSCLDAAGRTGAEIVVVDNASADNTREEVVRRKVRLIANAENRGFAAAVNQGVCALNTPLVLLLNPDAILLTGIQDLIQACQISGAAGAGGKLVDPAGGPQIGFMVRRFPTALSLLCEVLLVNRLWRRNPINRESRYLDLDYSRQQSVEQPAGAMLMFRREVWEALGGFDERYYPLWFEDVDFCKRAVHRKYVFYYVPTAVAQHTGAHSIAALSLQQRQLSWYGNLFRYTGGHFSLRLHRLVCVAVAAGALMRMVIACVAQRSLMPCGAYGKVISLAVRCLGIRRHGELSSHNFANFER
jgi:GT2 family glycosyltransferase